MLLENSIDRSGPILPSSWSWFGADLSFLRILRYFLLSIQISFSTCSGSCCVYESVTARFPAESSITCSVKVTTDKYSQSSSVMPTKILAGYGWNKASPVIHISEELYHKYYLFNFITFDKNNSVKDFNTVLFERSDIVLSSKLSSSKFIISSRFLLTASDQAQN